MRAEKADRAYTGNPEVDHLLFSWRRVIAGAEGWARGFALSIQRDRKRPGWTPSARQLEIMRRMVEELPMSDKGGGLTVIERDP